MAAPNRRSIDEEFRNASYNQNSWGVQNAQSSKMMTGVNPGNAANDNNRPQAKFQNDAFNQYSEPENAANENQTLTSRPSEDGRRRRMRPRYQGGYENNETDESSQAQRVENRYYQENQFPRQKVFSNTPKKASRSILKSGRATFFGVFSWSASIFIAPTQAIFLVLGFAMMGMASQSEETWTAWLAEKAAQITGWILGFEYPDLMAMAMGSFLFAGFLGLSFLFLFVLTALILGLHPFNGKGADKKHFLFMVAILLSPVPFGSIPWIRAVRKNSK